MASKNEAPEQQTAATVQGPRMPSADKVEAARAARKAAGLAAQLQVGTVLGLPAGWVAAKLDPTLDEGRKATLRAKWEAKGWIKLDGQHQVVGYPLGCEVWVKRSADFNADRLERDEQLREMARTGQVILGNA